LEVLHRLRVTRPGTAVVVITGQGTIDAAVEAMKAGATDFVEKPYEVDALRRTLRTVQEEQHARTLLGASAADGAVVRVLSDAVARRALWAVVGPRADPPSGATRVFPVEEEGPSTDRLRTEPILSAQHRDRSAHRKCRSSRRLRGLPVLPADRPRVRGHVSLGAPHERLLAAKGGAFILSSEDRALAEQS